MDSLSTQNETQTATSGFWPQVIDSISFYDKDYAKRASSNPVSILHRVNAFFVVAYKGFLEDLAEYLCGSIWE